MKNRISKVLVLLGIQVVLATGSVMGQSRPLPTVPNVDLDRYSGIWYEIAKYPNRFQKQCVGNTTATYTQKPNGKIEVLNRCLKADGTYEAAKGEAKVADKKTNSKLKVRFAPGFLSFLPFVWANYWIIDLGPNYEYVAIGEPDRKYFWILSREPDLRQPTYEAILRRASEMGFDPQRLEKTPQGVAAKTGSE